MHVNVLACATTSHASFFKILGQEDGDHLIRDAGRGCNRYELPPLLSNITSLFEQLALSGLLQGLARVPLARFLRENPDFEILGLFVLLLIGFVLFLEGGREALVSVNASEFPHIPQWIVIFTLLLMFSVDLYQNWWEQKFRKRAKAPLELGRLLTLDREKERFVGPGSDRANALVGREYREPFVVPEDI